MREPAAYSRSMDKDDVDEAPDELDVGQIRALQRIRNVGYEEAEGFARRAAQSRVSDHEAHHLGEQVWELHRALVEVASVDASLYLVSDIGVADIRVDTQNREAELALTAILASASPTLPTSLLDQAQSVARLVWANTSPSEVDADVRAWLAWQPDSGAAPPYST